MGEGGLYMETIAYPPLYLSLIFDLTPALPAPLRTVVYDFEILAPHYRTLRAVYLHLLCIFAHLRADPLRFAVQLRLTR
jgi:hypothetical protein